MNRRLLTVGLGLVVILGLITTPAIAKMKLTTLTFDEIPTQVVDGLSYSGVTFAFTVNGVPSTDAYYNRAGPGQIAYLQDPSLEGTDYGVLTLTFDKPTTVIEFGVARNTYGTYSNGATVELYRPGVGHLRESVMLETAPEVYWTEGWFSYTGPAVKTVVIYFEPLPSYSSRFAIDNLTFHKHPQS